MSEYVIQNSQAGIICGFIPEKWMVNNSPIYEYRPCCRKPSNWEGRGEWFTRNDGSPTRRVYCAVCNTWIFAADEMPADD